MNRLSIFSTLLAIVFLAAQCEENTTAKSLEGLWNCTSIAGLGKPEAATPTLQFSVADKNATGNGGCNAWFATFQADDNGAIKFGGIGATKMACNDDRAQIESAFFNALREADSYKFEPGGRLKLSKGKMELAAFEKQ